MTFQPDTTTKPATAYDVKVLRPSPDRCEHTCKHAAKCPASPWGIVNYDVQLREKRELVRRVLRGVVEPELVREMWPSPSQWGYRSRITLRIQAHPRGGFELGYASGAREAGIVPIQQCMLASRIIGRELKRLAAEFRDARTIAAEKFPSRLSLFSTADGVAALAIFQGRRQETDVQEFIEFAERLELDGGFWAAHGNSAGLVGERGMFWRVKESQLMQTGWLGHQLEVHPAGFTQVNDGAFDRVLRYLAEQRTRFSAPTTWDLYGGYGALGFAVASAGSQLVVVEQNGLSRSTFEQLAAARPEVQATFDETEVNRYLPRIKGRIGRDDLIILDPPRSGCHPEALDLIGKSRVRRLLCMSCNPARLARDVKLIAPAGFVVREVQPVDFFPQTPEIEVLALLER
ncbi:MAG: class I SAM-dependent RNA methyltransferase [bacterium]|nr:class I SAM-dependent RNA methyltransferase [bacterium]